VLIFSPSRFHFDKWLDQSARVSLFALGALCLFLLSYSLGYAWKVKEVPIDNFSTSKQGGTLFAYESIGSGGLALKQRHALGWVSRIADEISLLAYNSRPDVQSDELKMLVSLKHGKELLTLPNGKLFYLKETQHGKGLSSSETATGLWIKPILLENGAVLMEVGRKFNVKEGNVLEERGEFMAVPQGAPVRNQSVQQAFIKELKTARCFTQDLLIQKYGGREYASWRDKAILELIRGTSTYACFVSAGDFLLYDEGEWKVVSFEQLNNHQPVARVKSISAKGLEVEAWDDTGFYSVQVKIDVENPGRIHIKPETMLSGIRLRSGSAVSCAFGKRRVILKQGDWLLKTATGWRNLRRSDEIDHYLHHRLKGELFIFDSIEKEQGRLFMKGNLFDETRTQVQPLSLPIESDKSQGKTSRKRKSIAAAADRRAA
jgi:hypothetical protein